MAIDVDESVLGALAWSSIARSPMDQHFRFGMPDEFLAAVPVKFDPPTITRLQRFSESFVRVSSFLGLAELLNATVHCLSEESNDPGEAWAQSTLGWDCITTELRSLSAPARIVDGSVIMCSLLHLWALHLAAGATIACLQDTLRAVASIPFVEIETFLEDAVALEEETRLAAEEIEATGGNPFTSIRKCP